MIDIFNHALAALAPVADSKDDIIATLRVEVETLRRYGNKGCTAMADEELNQIKYPSMKRIYD